MSGQRRRSGNARACAGALDVSLVMRSPLSLGIATTSARD
jgi:hypothetical protein